MSIAVDAPRRRAPSSPSSGRLRNRAADATRARIIAAAVRHIGRYGPEGASLRSLLAEAGASASAASYHFGSKSGLYRAVADSYYERIRSRLEALMEAAVALPAGPERLRALVEAHIRPHLELVVGEGEHDYGLMALQFAADGQSSEWRGAEQVVRDLRERFRAALGDCCPGVDEARLGRGIGLVVAVMARAPFNTPSFSLTSRVIGDVPIDTLIEEAVSFASAGLSGLLGVSGNAR
ncbi:MAG: TetR family transcriptional regulator [Pseudomonadales bacterium]